MFANKLSWKLHFKGREGIVIRLFMNLEKSQRVWKGRGGVVAEGISVRRGGSVLGGKLTCIRKRTKGVKESTIF